MSLRALTSKRAEEVAHHLLDVFLIFGAPCVLQSDNGREFCNAVINSLQEMWPELHIVHGKPRHSQSQGSVERANQDIENMIFTWMSDHGSTKWSAAIRFVRFMKNRSFHAGIKRSPYEAVFGCHPKVGLDVLALPEVVLKTLRTEEELEKVCQPTVEEEDEDDPPATESIVDEPAPAPSSARLCTLCGTDVAPLQTSTCALCLRKNAIRHKRKESEDNLTRQAKKMKLASDRNFPAPTVGDTVRVQIPDVDRGKTDARNVLACVVDVIREKSYVNFHYNLPAIVE